MNKDFKIHFLNTIWADAILIERNNHFAMIDTASDFYYPMIKNYLDRLNIKELDFVLLTHFHSDHYGNLLDLYKDYKINKLYIKTYSNHEGTDGAGTDYNEEFLKGELDLYNNILDTARSKSKELIIVDQTPENQTKLDEYGYIDFDGVKIELFDCINHIDNIYKDINSEYYHQHICNENSNSLACFIKHNEHTILLAADITNFESKLDDLDMQATKIVKAIYSKHNINHIDVYKVMHHGCTGSQQELSDLINPDYCVITNTNRWLDNWETRNNFIKTNKNVCILQTDYNHYVFDFSKKEISYKAIEETSLFITLNKE